jgi:mannan endo-1,4-beta-mannosidase
MTSKRLLVAAAAAAVVTLGGSAVAVASTRATATGAATQVAPALTGFVKRSGANLKLNGSTFKLAGSNNYYLMYKSRLMVDDVFADARGAGFNVLRTWGFLDIGNQDGSNSVRGIQEGIYFQYWDPTQGRPVYNDGPTGLEKLDYVLYSARQHGIRLVIPLTNNWNDFGGMDQYVRWRDASNDGPSYHDDFYTDPVIRGWYKDWISHVLNRVNTLTGVAYKDDPTVMMWELGNEPRCLSAGAYPRGPNCTTQTLTAWADEMTRHIKSVDTNHLAGVGDEGFFCVDPAHTDWTRNCGEGVDTVAFAKLPAVDVMSFHIYPTAWSKDYAWTLDWIRDHVKEADKAGKPAFWGEFGWSDKATRNPVYKAWTDLFDNLGGDGWLYWILSGIQDDGTLYPDYDGFTVYCPSPVCITLTNASEELRGPQRSRPPVADHEVAVVEFNTGVTLKPADNDIAYRTKVKASTIDLDAATAGQQRTLTLTGGTFTLNADGSVTFTPAADFVGRAVAHYTIKDEAGRTSNVADISVTVKPDPAGAIPLASFEEDTEGWRSVNNLPITFDRTTEYATAGAYSLRVDATASAGDWVGRTFTPALDLSGKTMLKYDLRTNGHGTNMVAVLQVGSSFEWCQWPFGLWRDGGAPPATVELDIINGSSCPDLSSKLGQVQAVWIWVDGGGVYDIDNVRVE